MKKSVFGSRRQTPISAACISARERGCRMRASIPWDVKRMQYRRKKGKERDDNLPYFHEQVPGVISAHVDRHVRYSLIRGLGTRAKGFHDANDRIELNSRTTFSFPANPTTAMEIVRSPWNHFSLFLSFSFFLSSIAGCSSKSRKNKGFLDPGDLSHLRNIYLKFPKRVYLAPQVTSPPSLQT